MATLADKQIILHRESHYDPVEHKPLPSPSKKVNCVKVKQVESKGLTSLVTVSNDEIPKLPHVTEIIIPEEQPPERIAHDNYVKNNTQMNHEVRSPIVIGTSVSSLITGFNNKQLLSEILSKPNRNAFTSFEGLQNLDKAKSPESSPKREGARGKTTNFFQEFQSLEAQKNEFSKTHPVQKNEYFHFNESPGKQSKIDKNTVNDTGNSKIVLDTLKVQESHKIQENPKQEKINFSENQIQGNRKIQDVYKNPDSIKVQDVYKIPNSFKIQDSQKVPNVQKIQDNQKAQDLKRRQEIQKKHHMQEPQQCYELPNPQGPVDPHKSSNPQHRDIPDVPNNQNEGNYEKFDLSQNFEEYKIDECEIGDEFGVIGLPDVVAVECKEHSVTVTHVEDVEIPQLNTTSIQLLKRQLDSVSNGEKTPQGAQPRPNEPTYEHFLECTGLSSKSILTPSRLLSNHKDMLKPKDVKLRSKVKSGAFERQGSTIKYWSEPFI